MTGSLRHVDPTREPGRLARAYAGVAATRASRWISRRAFWRLDPLLLRLTGGRLATTLVFPTAVLETVGARSGRRRRNATIYFHDGDDVIVVAAHAGRPVHPSWLFNLRAEPAVVFGGIPMVAAEVVDEAERERLWSLAVRVFPAFERYRRDAAATGRSIPIVRLRR